MKLLGYHRTTEEARIGVYDETKKGWFCLSRKIAGKRCKGVLGRQGTEW
jgi:hypothetical protein